MRHVPSEPTRTKRDQGRETKGQRAGSGGRSAEERWVRVGRWLMLGAWAAWALPAAAQVTERPQTTPPGRVLMRIDGIRLSFDRSDAAGNTYDAVGVASTTLRTGLTETVDIQVGLDLFLRETIRSGGRRNSHSGIGDVAVRTKWTFWRDEKAGAAAAVMPYVRFPTGSGGMGSEAVEGGVIVPWAMETGAGFKAGAMFQWDTVRNDADNGYDARWFVSGFAIRDLTQTIAIYGEATAETRSTGFSESEVTIGAGVVWRLSKRLELDYELQRGINSRAAAWTHILRANWEW